MSDKIKNLTGSSPLPTFTSISSIAVIVGIVVGIGIFRLPPIVAASSASGLQFILFWVAGGIISLLGALCYAELASSNPDSGGEYHFLSKAYGPQVGFLFTWGRMTVIQTGSLALVSFILGDYATLIFDLGKFSPAIYAGLTIILLTGLNITGTKHSRKTQMALTAIIIFILVTISLAGLIAGKTGGSSGLTEGRGTGNWFAGGMPGAAMIFVLLTYGGWNEAAYLSGELINVRKNMIKVLIAGIATITMLYLLVNLAYLHVLGLEGLQNSQTVGADLTEPVFGTAGSFIVVAIVILAAVSTANATIITGARTNYALGRDFNLLVFMGRWDSKRNTPVNALLVQGTIALLLIIFGAWSKKAVETMVDYTAPVFWLFLLLTTTSLFILRKKNKNHDLPYKVPFYPVTPLLFIATCTFMLYSSLAYTGKGALVGAGFLVLGIPLYWLMHSQKKPAEFKPGA
jgi:basic amino acid/polyamine antiporter, APA family